MLRTTCPFQARFQVLYGHASPAGPVFIRVDLLVPMRGFNLEIAEKPNPFDATKFNASNSIEQLLAEQHVPPDRRHCGPQQRNLG
jgi:hypothetical protein